ncbi:MAG: hypothetical protein BGP06_18600 [Rhizobiales bacterium 65-9]|nr:MAG: hypothetical protein BGP06_18600 [Rhizobiales bacterium 65-9]
MRGRFIPLSLPRRIVADHCYFARKTPTGVLRRRINIAPLMKARADASKKAPWFALFLKGYALVAQQHAPLRRVYVKLPWPHLYEYPASVASLVIERDYKGEDALFLARLKNPAALSLGEIAAKITEAKGAPIESVKDFRLALRFARAPMLLRRALWWLGMNIGRQRANFFGTFGVTVLSGDGTEVNFPISPWTSLMSYGPISADGDVEIVIGFDHRVMDGAVISRAMGALETVLNSAIATEIAPRGAEAPASPAPARP